MKKKILVVFYSRTDNNRIVAREISELLKTDLGEILPEVNYSGFLGFLKAGVNALMQKQVRISCPKKSEDYKIVILVSPLWAGMLPPPSYSYISKNNFKKIAFFSCNGNGKAQKSLEQMRKLNKLPLETGFVSQNDFKDKLHPIKITEFCESLNKLMKK